jgi:hypothetical protein
MVVRDKDGKPYSVRYDQVNAMLLNEFLKEHQKMEEQGETIAQLKSGIEVHRNTEGAGCTNPGGDRPARRRDSVPRRT